MKINTTIFVCCVVALAPINLVVVTKFPFVLHFLIRTLPTFYSFARKIHCLFNIEDDHAVVVCSKTTDINDFASLIKLQESTAVLILWNCFVN